MGVATGVTALLHSRSFPNVVIDDGQVDSPPEYGP